MATTTRFPYDLKLAIRASAEQSVGATNTDSVDLGSAGATGHKPICAVVHVTDVGSSGTLDLIVQGSTDDSSFSAIVTYKQIDSTGKYHIWFEDESYRYFRINSTCGSEAVTWEAFLAA